MFVARRVLLSVAVSFALFGCEKKAAPPPPAPSGMPPLDEPAGAAPADKPVHEPMAAGALPPGHPALPPGHPSMGAMGAMGGGEPGAIDPKAATPGDIAFDPKSVISGVLRLDDKVKSKVAAGDTIFLVARAADASGAPGPILAVKKLTAEKWPMPFQLDARDAMMTGTKLAGKVVVSARVDKDGDAITKNPGDVTGNSRPIEPPVDKVVVSLDTVL